MTIFRVVVLEIRARSDFFTIVDPNYIEITRRTNYFTGQFNFSTIFSLDRFQMIYDRGRTWLETWFFAWCCSKKNGEIIIFFSDILMRKENFQVFFMSETNEKKVLQIHFSKSNNFVIFGLSLQPKSYWKKLENIYFEANRYTMNIFGSKSGH